MSELPKQAEPSNDTDEDLNLSAIKAFHRLLEIDKTLLPAWKDTALKLSEKEVPQDIDALKALLEGGGDAGPKTTQS
jgi:hypothetical protein